VFQAFLQSLSTHFKLLYALSLNDYCLDLEGAEPERHQLTPFAAIDAKYYSEPSQQQIESSADTLLQHRSNALASGGLMDMKYMRGLELKKSRTTKRKSKKN
jgi:hypothetical protein